MLTVEIADVLKAAPTATSLSGLSTMLVNSLGELAKTGAMLIRQNSTMFTDLNDVRDWRICVLDTLGVTTANAPAKANGMVFVSFGTIHIILRAGEGGLVYFRTYVSASGWNPWKKVSLEAMK